MLVFVKGFIGLLTITTSAFVLFFGSLLADRSIAGVPVPSAFALVAVATIGLAVIGTRCRFFTSPAGIRALRVVALVGSVAAPLGLLVDALWIPSIILMGLGLVAIVYLWCLYLDKLTHVLLELLLSLSAVLAAVAIGVVLAVDLSMLWSVVLTCVLALVSWLVLLTERDLHKTKNLQVSAEDSERHAVTKSVDRWTYSIIGLNLGFTLGLVRLLLGIDDHVSTWLFDPIACALTISVPIAIAGVLILAAGRRPSMDFKNHSKDFLAFTVSIGLIPLFFVPSALYPACLAILLLVSFMQTIIVADASIEFIKLEVLSPAWYMKEEAFVAGSAGIGILLTWLCSLDLIDMPVLQICMLLVLLVNILVQTFINKGAFPSLEMLQKDEAEKGERGLQEGSPEEETAAGAEGEERQGGIWRKKVAYVCETHELSPRQIEILTLLTKGRDAHYIEEHFNISRSTVKSHIYNIYGKLDVHSKQELLTLIEEAPVVDDAPRSGRSA